MTSDAKIGLLLGLVFIFVIAFIINGLPNFGSHPQSSNASQVTPFDSDNLGDLVGETGSANERLSLQDIMGQSPTEETPIAEDPALEIPESEMAASVADAGDEDNPYRGVWGLDDIGIGSSISQVWGNVVHGLTESGNEAMRMQNPTEESVPAVESSSADQSTGTTYRPASDRVQVSLGAEADRTPPPAQKAAGKSLLNRTYTVKEGETLATVAKNVYGSEEGNRLVNIKRIFSANALLLNSPDEIYAGQTLIIPPLPESQPSAEGETPNPTLSESLFEKVEAVGRRNLPNTPEPKQEGRSYTVQEGDSLWKIASAQLGSGARCDEIAKMNVDVLKNKNTLSIGMKLRLPSK